MLGVAAVVLLPVVAFSYREWEQSKRVNAEAARTRDLVDSICRHHGGIGNRSSLTLLGLGSKVQRHGFARRVEGVEDVVD
jgi:hypothetical protein